MWNTLGFTSQKEFFKNGVVAHAYLFVGQEMIGKKTFALELAGKFADTSDMFVMTSHDIDTVRTAKQFLSRTALNGTRKILVVDNAHHLSEEAQNALLKTLEEPSASTTIMLISSMPGGLLPTIVSRCQVIEFSAHPKKVVDEYLQDKKLSGEQKEFLYHFSNGSIGLLADDVGKIKKYIEEFSVLSKADINKRFDLAKSLATDEALRRKILYWMLYLRTKKLYKPLPGLLALYQTTSQPQFNEQLALENFMLTM